MNDTDFARQRGYGHAGRSMLTLPHILDVL